MGGEQPRISERTLQCGDRVLCFTDGLIEEHEAGEEQFGEEQLIHWINRIEHAEKGVRAVVRALSRRVCRAPRRQFPGAGDSPG